MIKVLIASAILLLPMQLLAESMEIESDKVVFYHTSDQAEFTGNVYLKRSDFNLRCDRLLAHYRNGQLEWAEAFGHIQLLQGDVIGRSKKAILDQKKNSLTLIEHAVLEQKGSRVEGEKIVHYINRDETVVQAGEGERTHMVIESDEGIGVPPAKEKVHE